MTAVEHLLRWGKRGGDPPPTLAEVATRAPRPDRKSGGSATLPPGDEPVVSVVIPVFDGDPHLERALGSVFDQSHSRVEIVVVDGGSTDGTLAILERHDHRIHSWFSERDDGMYDAINKGIAACRGNLVKILNADDELPEGSMSVAVNRIAADERVLLRGNMEVIDSQSRRLTEWSARHHASYLPAAFPVLHPSWYLPRSVYEEVGLYRPTHRIASDTDYFYRLLEAGIAIRHLDQPLIRFREGGMSSGYGGLLEGLVIHARYIGRGRAAYITARRGFEKVRANGLRKILGERGYHALRSTLGRAARGEIS